MEYVASLGLRLHSARKLTNCIISRFVAEGVFEITYHVPASLAKRCQLAVESEGFYVLQVPRLSIAAATAAAAAATAAVIAATTAHVIICELNDERE